MKRHSIVCPKCGNTLVSVMVCVKGGTIQPLKGFVSCPPCGKVFKVELKEIGV